METRSTRKKIHWRVRLERYLAELDRVVDAYKGEVDNIRELQKILNERTMQHHQILVALAARLDEIDNEGSEGL